MKELLEYVSNNTSLIKELITNLIWLLGFLGIAIDVNPKIKINPIRMLFQKLGKLLNLELYQKIEVLEERIKDINQKVDENERKSDEQRIKNIKGHILDFANTLSKRERDKEEFDAIYELHDEYDLLLEKYDLTNGKTDRAMKTVNTYYNKYIQNCDW